MWKIDSLSPLETSRLQTARQDWGLMHFRAIPVDRQKTSGAFYQVYRRVEPFVLPLSVWFQSPPAARLGVHILERYLTGVFSAIPLEPPRLLQDMMRSPLGTRILSDVWDQMVRLREQTRGDVWDRIGRSIIHRLSGLLISDVSRTSSKKMDPSIVAMMYANGADLIRWCEPRDDLYRHVAVDGMGPDPLMHLDRLDHWLAFALHETFRERRVLPRSATICELWKQCGGWYPYRGAVLLVERPCRISFDDQGRLHCPDGMALAYGDGCGLYMWHGVMVSEQVILRPSALTPLDILNEPNLEVRCIMIERHGLDRLLANTRPRCLDVDQGGQRTLFRLRLSHDEPIVAVKVRCPSTGRVYFLRVPPDVRTCRHAVAWTFGFEKVEEYQPVIET